MNRNQSRRFIAVLGTGLVLALTAGAASLAAIAPRGLPANPSQQETETPDRNPDRAEPRNPRDRGPVDRRGGRIERRLNFLHRELNIRPNQERAWNRFADAMRDEAQSLRDRFAEMRDRFRDRRDLARRDRGERPSSVLERLERQQQMLANRSERVERLLTDIRPLYAALDGNQRRAADRLLFRPFAGGGGPGFDRPMPGPGRFGRRDFGNGYDALQRRDTGRGFNRNPDPRNEPDAAPRDDRDTGSANGDAGSAPDIGDPADAENSDRDNL